MDKIRDRKRMRMMEWYVDYNPFIFGANGHYSVGDYHDLYEGYKDVEESNRKFYEPYIKEEEKKN